MNAEIINLVSDAFCYDRHKDLVRILESISDYVKYADHVFGGWITIDTEYQTIRIEESAETCEMGRKWKDDVRPKFLAIVPHLYAFQEGTLLMVKEGNLVYRYSGDREYGKITETIYREAKEDEG